MFKFFKKEIRSRSTRYTVLGIRFSIPNMDYIKKERKENEEQISIQNTYDLDPIRKAKKIILFLTPGDCKINGGVMSIFSLCSTTRQIKKDSCCLISTYPHDRLTYSKNTLFLNNEKVYRFSQVLDNCANVDSMIIHIPENISHKFVKKTSKRYLKKLRSIKNLHLNILNQNCELMPEPYELRPLYFLTKNITQTLSHDKFLTQEYCDKYNIPTHLFSVNIDISMYKSYKFTQKEKIIVLSPDVNKFSEQVKYHLETNMDEWRIVIVKNLTFHQYMDLIARAFFVITFGEGMDGYFVQPLFKGTLSISVYNNYFYPSEDWRQLMNVYDSYDDLISNICTDLNKFYLNSDTYYKIIDTAKEKLSSIYSSDKYCCNVKKFYKKLYDYTPREVLNVNGSL